MITYDLIRELSGSHNVRLLCRLLYVSKSAYYAYIGGRSYLPDALRSVHTDRIDEIFWEHKRRYGARRIMHELQEEGHNIGVKRIRKIMKELGIKAIQPKSFVPKTTVRDASVTRSPNLLLDMETPAKRINQVVVGDITYLPLKDGGWLYLCIWLDLYSRYIAGWKLDDNMEAAIVVESLEMLINRRKPPKGMIVHSDGGGQFKSIVFRELLGENRFRQSMTRLENHYDNAFAESLFSRLKAEMLSDYPTFVDLKDARMRVFEYIEGYYNIKRRHSSLGYLSPYEFENKVQ